jgi:hypothetical protein
LTIAAAFVVALIAPATSAAFVQFHSSSSDGSAVFFITDEQLVGADTDTRLDVYKRAGGTTILISRGQVNGNGAFPAYFSGASSDGSRVFFNTQEQLVSGDTDAVSDVYERSGGTTTHISQGQINGNGAIGAGFSDALSDGSKVFFITDEQLTATDTDAYTDIYERAGGTTTQISRGQINGNGAFSADFRGASGDGSRVFFRSNEQLAATDTDTSYDIYERSGGTTTQVSQGEVNGNGNANFISNPASNDGSKFFFQTSEPLVSGDTDSSQDIYERSGGTTTLVSYGEINGNGPFAAFNAHTSSDGEDVYFHTAESLHASDTDSSVDVYERGANGGPKSKGTGAFDAFLAGIPSDPSNREVFYRTNEQVPTLPGDAQDTDGVQDIYVAGEAPGLISVGHINGNGAFPAQFVGASSDGSKVYFTTDERLVSADTDALTDIYESAWVDGVTGLVSSAYDSTSVNAGPGDTVTTSTTATPADPIGTSVTTPMEGLVEINEGTTAAQPPGNYSFLGQQVLISAPAATAADPLVLEFTLDASLIPAGTTASNLQVFRNGALVPNCTAPTAASPDPCVATRVALAGGDVELTVRTSQASRWNFGVRAATVSRSGSTLVVTATPGAKDNLAITRPSASRLRVTDLAAGPYTGSRVDAGAGCTQAGNNAVNCGNAGGITLIRVNAGDQIDKVVNSTGVKSWLNGGAANDLLTGGAANDILTGGTGADRMNGMNGSDRLLARDLASDTKINCGGGSGDKADLDLLPRDPNSAITGCETKTRH